MGSVVQFLLVNLRTFDFRGGLQYDCGSFFAGFPCLAGLKGKPKRKPPIFWSGGGGPQKKPTRPYASRFRVVSRCITRCTTTFGKIRGGSSWFSCAIPWSASCPPFWTSASVAPWSFFFFLGGRVPFKLNKPPKNRGFRFLCSPGNPANQPFFSISPMEGWKWLPFFLFLRWKWTGLRCLKLSTHCREDHRRGATARFLGGDSFSILFDHRSF